MTDQLLSIGQLARSSGLTVKAIRYYDRIGLLRPVVIDAATGFRYFAPDQVGPARLIRALRSIDVPVDDVRRCLATPGDRAVLDPVLRAHQARLESRATRIAGHLHRLTHLLSDETENAMTTEPQTADQREPEDERRLAARLFNAVWDLLEKEDRSQDDDDRMLHMAHASRHHWGQIGSPPHLARGEWQCSRVYAVLHRSEPSLHHAGRVLQTCEAHGLVDFDLAFAYEALARAYAVAGDHGQARTMTERALVAADDIADDEDRKIVLADLETIPGQARFW